MPSKEDIDREMSGEIECEFPRRKQVYITPCVSKVMLLL